MRDPFETSFDDEDHEPVIIDDWKTTDTGIAAQINKGDLVRFKDPYPQDTTGNMRVIWTDSPRAMVELDMPGWTIKPTQIVLLCDLELVEG